MYMYRVKTEYINFEWWENKMEHTNLSMINRNFFTVSQFSFLWVLVDEYLSWKEPAKNRLKYISSK